MDSPSPAAQPLVDVLNLTCDVINLGLKIKADAGLSLTDGSLILDMLPDIGPAIRSLGAVPASVATLSPSDAPIVEAGVIAKLNLPSAAAVGITQAVLDVLVKIDALYEAIEAAKSLNTVAP